MSKSEEKYLKTKDLLEKKIKSCNDLEKKLDWIKTYQDICEDDYDKDIVNIHEDLIKLKDEDSKTIYSYDLPYDFMEEYKDELSWSLISSTQDLSSEFIIRNKYYINFDHLNLKNYFNLSDSDLEILDEIDKVNWSSISMREDLSIDFIRTYKDKLNWSYISINSDFTEDQMVEFKDYIDWEKAVICQVYSDDFKEKYELDEYIDEITNKSKGFVKEREESFEKSSIAIFENEEHEEEYYSKLKEVITDNVDKEFSVCDNIRVDSTNPNVSNVWDNPQKKPLM